MSTQSLSLSRIQIELDELRKDRDSFVRAYDIIRRRMQDSLSSTRPLPPLHKWSGSRAVVGSLELVIQHIEKNIEEHSEAVRLIREGLIENSDTDIPRLGVIQGGDGEL